MPSAVRRGVARSELDAWISDLRGRVARGELDGLGSIPVDGSALLGTVTVVRIMLADLDHYDDLTPEQRQDPLVEARRRLLLADFRRLREQIG